MAQWDGRHHGAYHLHGHSHGTHHAEGAILDVGVDCHDYRPLSLEEVLALCEARTLETTAV
jgi:calcineurin-like phosphoesterase family protein